MNFEIDEIKQTLAIEEQYESRGIIKPWLDLVSTKANRYRMFLITFLVIGIDWCGTSITSYYASLLSLKRLDAHLMMISSRPFFGLSASPRRTSSE